MSRPFKAGYGDAVVRAYRDAILIIGAARDVRELISWRSLRFEASDDGRLWAVRLHGEWRLILEPAGSAENPAVHVVAIEDHLQMLTQGKR